MFISAITLDGVTSITGFSVSALADALFSTPYVGLYQRLSKDETNRKLSALYYKQVPLYSWLVLCLDYAFHNNHISWWSKYRNQNNTDYLGWDCFNNLKTILLMTHFYINQNKSRENSFNEAQARNIYKVNTINNKQQ